MTTRFISPQDPRRKLVDGVDIMLDFNSQHTYTNQPMFKILDMAEECWCEEMDRNWRVDYGKMRIGTCGPDCDSRFHFNPRIPETAGDFFVKQGHLPSESDFK